MSTVSTEYIAQAGVVGAGGAGFPTHVKLTAQADTVVVNAAECEPLLHKDKELLVHRAEPFVEGLAEALRLTGASRGVVGIKGKYKDVIASLTNRLARGMDIVTLDDAYPSGDEITLIYETLGRVVAPGALPITVGAVVLNVETACNLAGALQGQGVTGKYLTVGGDVARPVSLCVPIGTPLSACVRAAGGATIDNPAFVIGGAMMGYVEDDMDNPVTKTTGGILVLPQEHFVVERKRWTAERTTRVGRAACDQCSFCTELCPRYLLGHPIEPHRAMRSLGFNLSRQSDVPGTVFCCECNLCSYYSCPEGLDPKNVCVENKRRILEARQRWENPPFSPDRPTRHQGNRKTPTSRLIRKIGLASYVNKGPLVDIAVEPETVRIPLRQHIGAPCVPTVRTGDAVRAGQTIAVRPVVDGRPALGADIHASIDGRVERIDESVVLRKN